MNGFRIFPRKTIKSMVEEMRPVDKMYEFGGRGAKSKIAEAILVGL